MRQSEKLLLRKQALEYTVPWNDKGAKNDDGPMTVSEKSSESDMS